MNNRHKWRSDVAMKLNSTQAQLGLAFVRQIVNALPGVSEKPCYNTPAFYVNKKIFTRLKEDCETLVMQTFEREKWIEKDPETFYVTDHYLNYDYMLVTLNSVKPEELEHLLITAWRNRAPAKLVQQYNEEQNAH